jgi:uncharacterized membrane protein HdeD (DUF308 family)
MFSQLVRNWWTYAARGMIAIIFGFVALVWPEATKLALVFVFGAYALVDGLFAVITGLAARRYFEYWWAVLLEGLAGIVIGLMAFFWPNITALAFLYLIATWAILTGIFEIVAAVQFRRLITGEWTMVLSGLLSIVFGVLMFVFPTSGLVSLVWLIGIYAVVFGSSEIIFAFRLRNLGREIEKASASAI